MNFQNEKINSLECEDEKFANKKKYVPDTQPKILGQYQLKNIVK